MPKRKTTWLRLLNEIGPLIAGAVALALTVAVIAPASAQFFPFGRPYQPQQQRQPSPFGGFPFFSPFEQPAPRPQARIDNSRAPPPEKSDAIPERNVLVLGDAMADWLGYGLEQAFEDQPDMGVTRKHKTVSGLIRYQPRGEPADWAAAAKTIIAAEKADVIVVMLGLNDRTSIREPVQDKNDGKDVKPDSKGRADAKKKPDAKADAKAAPKPDATKPDAARPDGVKTDAARPDAARPGPASEARVGEKTDRIVDAEQSPDDAADESAPPSITAEKSARTPNGVYEFRDARWVELYNRKIDELIAILKTKGAPILWVGLPALRGTKATADVLFLDSLYREGAAKANITYVDVWDGFVDEAGRFLQQGPDFEGQTRRLRSADGVYFTKPGARKLAHYVDREIKRVLTNRPLAVALPTEPAMPDDEAEPGKPAPRPLVGPAVPLVAAAISASELLGGSGTRPAPVDPLAARTLVKGEPLSAPAGRADDYSWPRREVGSMESAKDPAVAAAGPDGAAAAAKQVRRRPRPAVANPNAAPPAGGGFGWPSLFGGNRPAAAPAQPQQRPPGPRPPATIGRSASAPPPGWFAR